MTIALVVIGTLVLLAGTSLVFRRQGHPEDASEHAEPEPNPGPTGEPYPTGSRPAGPGAEGMQTPEPGSVSPAPSPGDDDASD